MDFDLSRGYLKYDTQNGMLLTTTSVTIFKVFMTIFLTKVAKITGDSLGYFRKCLFKSKLQSMGQIFDTIRLSSGHTDCIKNTSKGVKTLLRTHPYKKPSIEVQLLHRIDTSFSLIKGYGKS